MKRNGLQYKRLEYVMGHLGKKGQTNLPQHLRQMHPNEKEVQALQKSKGDEDCMKKLIHCT